VNWFGPANQLGNPSRLRECRVSRRIRDFHSIADRDKLSECWPDLQNQDVRRPAEPTVSRHSLRIPVHPLAQNYLLSVGFFRGLVGPQLEAHNTILYSRKKHLQAHIGRNLGRSFLNKHAARGTSITSDREEGCL